MKTSFVFSTVRDIRFGVGRTAELPGVVRPFGSRAFIVTGRHALRQSGLIGRIQSSLESEGVEVRIFGDVRPEPSLASIVSGLQALREDPCDAVIAIGGGSAIDVGKAIACLYAAEGQVSEYFQGRVPQRKGLPFIAMPTTSGSGAEVTPNSVLTDDETGIKASIRGSHMLADAVIVDPELTLTVPPDVTAFSGMDALCQAIESYVSIGASAVTDALASSAAVRLYEHLPKAYYEGSDLLSRTQLAQGSLMAGMAFANSRLGLVHGLAHPVGVLAGLPHGLVCALLLPDVIRFNMEVSAAKYAALARTIGVAEHGASDSVAAAALIEAIESINEELGIAQRRGELRLPCENIADVVDQAVSSGSTRSNPRRVSAADISAFIKHVGMIRPAGQ